MASSYTATEKSTLAAGLLWEWRSLVAEQRAVYTTLRQAPHPRYPPTDVQPEHADLLAQYMAAATTYLVQRRLAGQAAWATYMADNKARLACVDPSYRGAEGEALAGAYARYTNKIMKGAVLGVCGCYFLPTVAVYGFLRWQHANMQHLVDTTIEALSISGNVFHRLDGGPPPPEGSDSALVRAVKVSEDVVAATTLSPLNTALKVGVGALKSIYSWTVGPILCWILQWTAIPLVYTASMAAATAMTDGGRFAFCLDVFTRFMTDGLSTYTGILGKNFSPKIIWDSYTIANSTVSVAGSGTHVLAGGSKTIASWANRLAHQVYDEHLASLEHYRIDWHDYVAGPLKELAFWATELYDQQYLALPPGLSSQGLMLGHAEFPVQPAPGFLPGRLDVVGNTNAFESDTNMNGNIEWGPFSGPTSDRNGLCFQLAMARHQEDVDPEDRWVTIRYANTVGKNPQQWKSQTGAFKYPYTERREVGLLANGQKDASSGQKDAVYSVTAFEEPDSLVFNPYATFTSGYRELQCQWSHCPLAVRDSWLLWKGANKTDTGLRSFRDFFQTYNNGTLPWNALPLYTEQARRARAHGAGLTQAELLYTAVALHTSSPYELMGCVLNGMENGQLRLVTDDTTGQRGWAATEQSGWVMHHGYSGCEIPQDLAAIAKADPVLMNSPIVAQQVKHIAANVGNSYAVWQALNNASQGLSTRGQKLLKDGEKAVKAISGSSQPKEQLISMGLFQQLKLSVYDALGWVTQQEKWGQGLDQPALSDGAAYYNVMTPRDTTRDIEFKKSEATDRLD